MFLTAVYGVMFQVISTHGSLVPLASSKLFCINLEPLGVILCWGCCCARWDVDYAGKVVEHLWQWCFLLIWSFQSVVLKTELIRETLLTTNLEMYIRQVDMPVHNDLH